jgi:hypothetical protein
MAPSSAPIQTLEAPTATAMYTFSYAWYRENPAARVNTKPGKKAIVAIVKKTIKTKGPRM